MRKNTLKKIFNIVLIIVFTLSLTACGSLKVDVPELSVPKDAVNSALNSTENKNSNEKAKESTKNKEDNSKDTKDNKNIENTESNSDNSSEKTTTKEEKEEKSSEDTTSNTCTISISCKTAIDKGVNKKPEFAHLPADGVILPTTTREFKDGDTVYDVLQQVVIDKGIHMEYTGVGSTIYIQGIDNIYEFDGGRWSGWMYCVNDWYPNYGCGSYKVKPGDVIEWNYTCDLGEDLGQHWLGEDIREKEK